MARVLLRQPAMARRVETLWGIRFRDCALALSALALASCANMPSNVSGADPASGPEPKGQVVVALATATGITVSSFSWQVTSSTNQVLASGMTSSILPGIAPSLIIGLPAAIGDRVSMNVTTGSGVHCTGTSSPFNVVAGQSNPVSVNVNCDATRTDGGNGSIVVTGVLVSGDNCPALSAWTLSPQSAAANGGTIDVGVTAADADTGDTLTFAWSATAGTFAGASLATTKYTCAASGDQTLSVVVSDNHMPSACSITATFPVVSCL
jgi:hypothetical protein